MMQEDELVIKDSSLSHIDIHTRGGREVQPFTISGMLSNMQNTDYHYSKFEIFVTIVVMMSTISGGFLEGYTSPAIPDLLIKSDSYNISDSVISNETQELINQTIFTYIPYVNLTSQKPDQPELVKNFTDKIDPNVNYINESVIIKDLQPITLSPNEETTTYLIEELLTVTLLPDDSDQEIDLTVTPGTSSVIATKTFVKRNVASTTATSQYLLVSLTDAAAPSEENSLKITKEQASWLGSLLLLGACLGAAFSSWIVSLGRRHAILFSALPRICGWALIASSASVSTLYAGRFISGISLGMVSTAAPIYISEISHSSLRGSLNCTVQLGVNIGIFLAALFGTFMSWQSLAILGGVFVLFYFFPTISIPNSPSWLVATGKEDEARGVLKKLRGNSFSVEEELQQIITLAEKSDKQNGIAWMDLFRQRRCRMPLLIVILVTLVNRFSGYNAIITYCVTFLHDAVPFVSQYASAAAVCFVQIIATGFSITIVDKWGRRKLLLFSICSMGLSLVVISICKGVLPSTSASGSWVTVLATMTFVGSYSVGIGPLTWVLLGELFPMDARDKASALVSVLNWMSAFLITKTFFNMQSTLGVGGTCLVYAGVCCVGAVCFYFLVPETKGRTLAEIEAHFTYSQVSWRNLTPKVDRVMSSILDSDTSATIDTYSTFQ